MKYIISGGKSIEYSHLFDEFSSYFRCRLHMREKNRSEAHGRVVESSRRRMEENYCEMHRYER